MARYTMTEIEEELALQTQTHRVRSSKEQADYRAQRKADGKARKERKQTRELRAWAPAN